MFAGSLMMRCAPCSSGGGEIVFVGSASGTGTGAAPPVLDLASLAGGTGNAPEPGDIVVIGFHHGAVSSAAQTRIGSAGYTILADVYEPGSSFRRTGFEVGWKIMGATPDATVTFTGSGTVTHGCSAIALVFRGVDQTAPIDAATQTATGTADNQPDPPAITPASTGAMIVALGAGANSTTAFTLSAADLDGFVAVAHAATVSSNTGGGYRISTGGAFDPEAWTGGVAGAANTWAAVTLALRPEAA